MQGAWEGVADELEQNGLKDFSADRAKVNAITGAMAGAATGALNSAVDKNLASKGGNLFAGNNKLTQGLNNLGAKHNVASTLATGVGRGALSGAVGGAAGAATQSAISGDELGQGIGNTLQGALSGAGQGAIIGGTMAGANMAARQGLNTLRQTGQAVSDFTNRMQNADGNALQRFGSAISDTLNSGDSWVGNKIDGVRSGITNRGAVNRLASALRDSVDGGATGNVKFVRLSSELLDDINSVRSAQGLDPLNSRQVIAYENAINNNLNNRIYEGLSADTVARMAYDSLTSSSAEALPGRYENTLTVSPYNGKYNGSVLGSFEGATSLKSIEPRDTSQVESLRATKNDLLSQSGSPLAANQGGGVTQTSSTEGSTSLGDNAAPLRARDPIVSQNAQNVNTGGASDPSTEVYRTLTGQNGGGATSDETSTPTRSVGQGTSGDQSVTSKEYRQIQRRNEALLEQYGTLSRRVTQAVNPAETVGKMADVGFTKPQDVESVVKYVTGSDGKLNILNKKVVASADPVNTWDGLTDGQTLTDFIDDQIALDGFYKMNPKDPEMAKKALAKLKSA